MSVLTLTLPRPSVDDAAFREAMAHLGSGVAIAACWDGSTPRGLLVSSLTALSTEPPRVLFCVKKAASAHGAFLRAQECSLTLLAEEDRREAERFSRSELTHERFDPEAWRLDSREPPRHRTGLVSLSGFVDQKIDAGSHSIFILRIGEAQIQDRRPLIYFDRIFHRLLPLTDEPAVVHGPNTVAHDIET